MASQALTVIHVENDAVRCNTVQKSSDNMWIMEEAAPFIKTELSSNYGCRFIVAPSEKIKEQAGLFFLAGNITQLINQKYVIADELFDELMLCVIGSWLKKDMDQFTEVNEASPVAMI